MGSNAYILVCVYCNYCFYIIKPNKKIIIKKVFKLSIYKIPAPPRLFLNDFRRTAGPRCVGRGYGGSGGGEGVGDMVRRGGGRGVG